MKILQGQVAFITGGASGIGLGIAQACGERGMKVMIADIEEKALAPALEQLRRAGVEAEGLQVDVASRAAVEDAAARTFERFGAVHLVCNNAGVAITDVLGEITENDWKWIVDVNMRGVIHGVEAFAPRLIKQGVAGHIVNTASIAGILAFPGYSPYSATKYAVVGMSEAWKMQLAPNQIGVSVLCPGAIRSNIFSSRRNRSEAYGEGTSHVMGSEHERASIEQGLAPEMVARYVLECVESGEFYIFSHNEFRPMVENHAASLRAAFEATRKSRSMGAIAPQELPEGFKTLPSAASLNRAG